MKIVKVSGKFGLSVDTLRYYERPCPSRQSIAIRAASAMPMGVRKEILLEQRNLLATWREEMQKSPALLNHKIEVYEKAILTKEREMLQIKELREGSLSWFEGYTGPQAA